MKEKSPTSIRIKIDPMIPETFIKRDSAVSFNYNY